MKQYSEQGLAGCVQLRKSRRTGTMVGVFRAEQAGLDDHDGENPWVTTCDEHGTVCNHRTLSDALDHAPCVDWCEDCMSEVA